VATGKQHFLCDTTVPPTRIPVLQGVIAAIGERHQLTIPVLGHAGDGNLHPIILFDGDDPGQSAAAVRAHEELTTATLVLGGTITGEHGIGSEKRHTMAQRFGPAEIAAMRTVKAAFDPLQLLNPGILLPALAPDEPGLPQFAVAMEEVLTARRTGRPWAASMVKTWSSAEESTPMAVDAENRTVTVAAATPLSVLHEALAAYGLQSPLPSTGQTVGALVSRDTAARGTVRDTLLAVRAALPDGPIVRFGGSTVKDVAGYDLKRLFIGSGSQFGSLNEVTLQVHVQSGR
jgi:glycolate oxidase